MWMFMHGCVTNIHITSVLMCKMLIFYICQYLYICHILLFYAFAYTDYLQMYINEFVIVCKDYTAFYLKCSINVEDNSYPS